MEDHCGILLEIQDIFISILDSASSFKQCSNSDVCDATITLIEFIKTFYMNFPLPRQMSSVLSSDFNESKFFDFEPDSDINIKYTSTSKEERDKIISNNDSFNYTVANMSICNDGPEKNYTYIGYGNYKIITIMKSQKSSTKFIIRNISGKRAWIITQQGLLNENALKFTKSFIEDDTGDDLEYKINKIVKEVNQKNDYDIDEERSHIEDVDILTKVMNLVYTYFPEVESLKKRKKNKLEENNEEFLKFKESIMKMEHDEEILGKINKEQYKEDIKSLIAYQLEILNEEKFDDEFNIDHIKTYLTKDNYIEKSDEKNIDKWRFFDENDSELKKTIKFLDTDCNLRRSIRIGVIYVEDDLDQKSILQSDRGSSNYEKWLKELGMPFSKVALRKLDKIKISFLYYASVLYEIIYHVVTRMPTNPNDPQQLDKKKYVGNDSVHIVWCENDKVYKPGVITGDFNFEIGRAHV